MDADKNYIKIKPDELTKADFEIAIKVAEISPIPVCECWICETRGSHLAPIGDI